MIIGIVSQINSGKDTMAHMLCEDFNFVQMAFADPLKDFCRKMFPDLITEEMLYGDSDKRAPVRELLQVLGTDVARNFDDDVWVKHTKKRIEWFQAAGEDHLGRISGFRPMASIVLSDVRFRNEAEFILENPQGYLVSLTRPGNYDNTPPEQRAHESETQFLTIPKEWFSGKVVNDGTLDDLRQNVKLLVERLKNRG